MAQDGKNKKHFFKEFKAEIKKVIWPTPKQIVNGTIAVITIVLLVAVIVFLLDLAFDMFNEYGVNKLKQTIQDSRTIDEGEQDNQSDVEPDLDYDVLPDDGDGTV